MGDRLALELGLETVDLCSQGLGGLEGFLGGDVKGAVECVDGKVGFVGGGWVAADAVDAEFVQLLAFA